MPNLRIIYDNAADRAALTASTTAGTLTASNLLTDIKSVVWRATGTTARLAATWTTAEAIRGIFLPYCNFTAAATWRVRVSTELAATNLILRSSARRTSPWITGATYFASASTQVCPDGSTNATLYGPTVGNTSFSGNVNLQEVLLAAAGTYTYSEWVACTGISDTVRVLPVDSANSAYSFGGVVRPSTGQILTTTAGSGTINPDNYFTIGPLQNGMRRVSVTFTTNTPNITIRFRLFPYSGTSVIIGDGASGIIAWGGMLSAGLLSSYYPTTSAAATRPAGYIDSWQSYDYDSGYVVACPGGGASLRAWANTPVGANAYGYGGGACARLWLPTAMQATGMALDISDTTNAAGYVEAARLVVGDCWEPVYNSDYGSPITAADLSTHFRNDASDLMTNIGTRHKKQPLNLSNMPASDRSVLWDILMGNGMPIPIMLSMYPLSADPARERAHQLYGKLMTMPGVGNPSFGRYATSLEFEEV